MKAETKVATTLGIFPLFFFFSSWAYRYSKPQKVLWEGSEILHGLLSNTNILRFGNFYFELLGLHNGLINLLLLVMLLLGPML
jgi:hypothetical protein